jgi:hypothetical protein
VAETPAERRRCIVRFEVVKKRAVRKYTNHSVTPPPSLAQYAAYTTGASSSRRRPRSLTPSASSDDDNDEAESRRIIGSEAARVQALEEALSVSSGESSAEHDLPGYRLF